MTEVIWTAPTGDSLSLVNTWVSYWSLYSSGLLWATSRATPSTSATCWCGSGEYWPLIGQNISYSLLIGPHRSRDLITGLWLVNTGHVTWILASNWSALVTWPEYCLLIGQYFQVGIKFSSPFGAKFVIPLHDAWFYKRMKQKRNTCVFINFETNELPTNMDLKIKPMQWVFHPYHKKMGWYAVYLFLKRMSYLPTSINLKINPMNWTRMIFPEE